MNDELTGVNFGSDLTLFVLLFVTAFDDPEENHRWARANTKLGRSRKDANGETARIQSFGVSVTRSEMKYLTGANLAEYLASAASVAFRSEALKTAKGLDWVTLRQEILTRLSSAIQSAA